MNGPPEARICLRKLRNGLTELSVYVPATGKETRTGMKVPPDRVDQEVEKLKHVLERGRSWVTVHSI